MTILEVTWIITQQNVARPVYYVCVHAGQTDSDDVATRHTVWHLASLLSLHDPGPVAQWRDAALLVYV